MRKCPREDALADACGLSVEEYVRTVLQREVALAPDDDLAEDRASFEEFQRTRVGIPGEEVEAWLQSLTTDRPLLRPKARKLD